MRAHGLVVDDCPRHLSRGQSTHSIIVEEENFKIPLKLHGIMSYFDVRTPTEEELQNCPHIDFTSYSEEWEPYSSTFSNMEASIAQKDASNIQSYHTYHHNSNQGNQGIEYEDYPDQIMRQLSATTTTKKQLFIKAYELSKQWMISLQNAEKTVKATTQSFIRNAVHPIERKFRTKVATLRYNHLRCRFSSDTFFSSQRSVLNNTCGQLFGYAKFMPMQSKAEAPLALQELIQDVGIPNHVHTDGAKEMTMGQWKSICNDYGIKMT
jgi:hypothetical protein